MKFIQEKVGHDRAKTAIFLLIVLLLLSVIATVAMVCLIDLFSADL